MNSDNNLKNNLKRFGKQWQLHTMLLPGVLLLFLFHYKPLYGLLIAFKHYQITDLKMLESPWAGFAHFIDFLTDPDFWEVLRNSLGINVLGLIVGFPIPILFALFLNEIRNMRFKRITQTVSYLPHFISWVVYGGIVINLLSPSFGIINEVLLKLKIIEEPVFFIGQPKYFWGIAVISKSAKEFGWGAILYLSAMAGINVELYEAAFMDGAGRFQRMWHITLPGIIGTMVILLILTISNILNWGFDQIWMLQNNLTLDMSETLETYVYRRGLINIRFAYATAVGLMKSVIAVILLMLTNLLSKKATGKGLY